MLRVFSGKVSDYSFLFRVVTVFTNMLFSIEADERGENGMLEAAFRKQRTVVAPRGTFTGCYPRKVAGWNYMVNLTVLLALGKKTIAPRK